MTGELITTTGGELVTIESGGELAQNAAIVYLSGLQSKASRRTMRGCLDKVARLLAEGHDALSFPWASLRFAHVAAIRAELGEDLSAATVNKHLCAVRGVLKAAWRLGQMSGDDYRMAVDVAGLKYETIPAGRALTTGEIGALMAACAGDPGPLGVRDAAMIAILRICGLRRAELVGLDLSDYDAETGALIVKGKGSKQRLAYATNGAADALGDWLTVRGDAPGALFCPILKGGRVQAGQRLAAQTVLDVLRTRAGQAGVKRFSPHDMRRTFVGDLLDAGADIATVQKMAGHASVDTTARYDRRPEQAKRKAAGLLHVPYRRRAE